jgi:antitoxin ParD1/3/4
MKPAGQMTITLTPELEQFVRREVEKGGFATNSEYIRDVLRERYLKVREREEVRESFEASLRQALKDIEEGRETDLEDAFREVRERLHLPPE